MKATRDYSKRQEEFGNTYLGLRTTSNSGATPFDKGDGEDEYFLMEWKTLTRKQKSQSLKREWFETNRKEMFAMGREINGIGFDFGYIGDEASTHIAFNIRDAKILMDCYRQIRDEENMNE